MPNTTTNTEYEDALLGAILMDNRIIEEHAIQSRYFSASRAQEVFRAIQETMGKGATANIVEVARTLPSQAAYIAHLTDGILSASGAAYYVKELRNLAQKREIVRLSRQMAEMVSDDENSAEEIIGACDRGLMEVAMSSERGYRHVSEIIPGTIAEIEAAYEHRGGLSGIDTGFSDLNARTGGFQKQWMVVIGARPGSGKTTIALNMITAALKQGKSVGLFSAEMSAESIMKRFFADWGNTDHRSMVTGFVDNSVLDKINEAASQLVEKRLYINDKANIPLNELVAEAYRMKRREGIDIAFVDYLSLVSNKSKAPRHEQVAEISQALKGLARTLDIPIIALSQLNRESQDERPKMSHLRDSGSIEQDSDLIILLWNKGSKAPDDPKKDVTMIVSKHRHGPTGEKDMVFHATRMRFFDIENS